MSLKYLKIKPENDFLGKYNINSFTLEYVNIFIEKNEMELNITVNNYDMINDLDDLFKILGNSFGNHFNYNVEYNVISSLAEKDYIDLVNFIIKFNANISMGYRSIFDNYKVEKTEDDSVIKIKLPEYSIEQAKNYNIINEIEKKIFDSIGKHIKLEIISDAFEEIDQKFKEEELKHEESIRNISKVLQEKAEEDKKNSINQRNQNNKYITKNNENNVYKYSRSVSKSMPTSPFSILKVLQLGEKIALEGQIFQINSMKTKTGSIKYDIYITDYTDSAQCLIFSKPDQTLDIKKGDWIRVIGEYQYDQFSRVKNIKTTIIDKIEDKTVYRYDKAEKKRIELHAHTNMSEMSGVTSAQALTKQAKDFGHKAIAITDFGVVHSYPFAYKASSDDFKVIFGIEAYVVDDEQSMITKPKDILIDEENYVVFDIETTGLDPHNDKIIEIGAIKLQAGKIVEEFSTFINPEREISQEITKLTSITNEMVKDADTIDIVLPKFLDFCGDSTVVAHNAKFDVGFITQKAKELGREYSPSVIDTLHWGRVLLPQLKRFGLKYIANHFNVSLENHHRAVDDTKATSEIFMKFLDMITRKGILKLTEINEQLYTNIQNSETLNTIILVKNQAGLKTLYELVSRSHLEFFGNKKPRIPKSILSKNRENLLLCSSASAVFGNTGEIINMYIRGLDEEEIKEKANFYDYFELHPLATYNDLVESGEMESLSTIQEINKKIYNLAVDLGKLVVATGDVQYLEERESINRSVLILGSGQNRKTAQYDKKLYFRTTEEMLEEFNYFGEDIANEIVVENTNKINDMIEHVRPIPKGFYPPKIDGAEEEVRSMTYKKLNELYGDKVPSFLTERIEKELNAIIGNGFAVLYLIAQKLVKKSVDNGYLVGSRGSVGSSIVAYLMGITEVNGLYPHYRCPNCKESEFMDQEGSGVDLPDKDCPICGTKYIKDGHAIPFEVFMGFDGDKVPDIDLNFSGEYQGEIHKYTEELFGSDNVFRAGTISTLAEKNAFGYVKKYFEEIEGTTEISKSHAEVTRISQGCEGARKTTGQHPGGMIVVPSDKSIYDFCPVQRPANDVKSETKTTHFDYHVMDEQLVKLDILGHDDPTTLRILQDLTGINIYEIPLDDPKVMSLFNSTESLGVTPEQIGSNLGSSGIPEFGTGFVKQMLEETKPTTFAELVRISGLSHGTDVWLNNAQEYVRQGVATLSEVITVRDDIMNYLIDNGIDKSVAFSIMEFVRKGQPTKNREKWKEYADLMKSHNVKQWYIDSCEKIKYMFPKGHAVAYVMMAVRIAYFKVHYPIEFYTAFLNRKVNEFKMTAMHKDVEQLKESRQILENKINLNANEKQELFLYDILIEMHYRGIEMVQPDIYKSESKRFIIEDGKIRMPLIAVDGLGISVADNVVAEREVEKFLSVEDLVKRTKLNKTVMELLKTYNCMPNLSMKNQQTLW